MSRPKHGQWACGNETLLAEAVHTYRELAQALALSLAQITIYARTIPGTPAVVCELAEEAAMRPIVQRHLAAARKGDS